MARQALRKWRQQEDLTQEAAALRCGVATSTWWFWEAGTKTPLSGRRGTIAKRCGVPLDEVNRWFDGEVAPNGHTVPGWLDHFASVEQGAAQIWRFEPIVVPGLLQTESYAAAVERVGPEPTPSDDEVARKVEMRLLRQGVLIRDPDPLELSVVLDESVLHRLAGGAEIMATQLDHLTRLSEAPNIDIRVLPFDAGDFSAAFGAFTVFLNTAGPVLANVDDRGGPHLLTRPHQVADHVELFEHLAGVALSPAESSHMFRSIAKEKYQ